MLCTYLKGDDFDVEAAHNGSDALARLATEQFDLLVLDIMMPGMDGLAVLGELRPHNTIPVLILSARGEEIDDIVRPGLGADDYLCKPCNPKVLSARIRALLRLAESRELRGEPRPRWR